MLVGFPKAFNRAFGNVILLLLTQDNDLVTRRAMLFTCFKDAFLFLMQKNFIES